MPTQITEIQLKAILTEVISRGDGSYLLRPVPVSTDFEKWVGTELAASLLGIDPNSVRETLCDPNEPYLVYRRPLKGKYLISLDSIVEFKAATSDPKFWTEGNTRARLKYSQAVFSKIETLIRRGKPAQDTKPTPILPLKLI